ncbi:unnamed protein product [Sphagnum balticum]
MEVKQLRDKLRAAEQLCEEYMDDNEQLKRDMRDLQTEIDESQDQYREEEIDEFQGSATRVGAGARGSSIQDGGRELLHEGTSARIGDKGEKRGSGGVQQQGADKRDNSSSEARAAAARQSANNLDALGIPNKVADAAQLQRRPVADPVGTGRARESSAQIKVGKDRKEHEELSSRANLLEKQVNRSGGRTAFSERELTAAVPDTYYKQKIKLLEVRAKAHSLEEGAGDLVSTTDSLDSSSNAAPTGKESPSLSISQPSDESKKGHHSMALMEQEMQGAS